ERKPINDAIFQTQLETPGTVIPRNSATALGNGSYEAPMIMALTPQLNRISWQVRAHAERLLYKTGNGARLLEVDPAVVDLNTHRVQRVRDDDHEWELAGDFSLWGVKPEITSVSPDPIFLREDGSTAHETRISYRIEPPEYAELLDQFDVLF